MAVKLNKLLEVIPSDTEAVVARARDETNQAIRERLRQLTGFRFGGARKPGAEDELADAMPVRVALAPGLPAELADKSIEEEEWALALLALHRPALVQLKVVVTISCQSCRSCSAIPSDNGSLMAETPH